MKGDIATLKQENVVPKLRPQIWKHTKQCSLYVIASGVHLVRTKVPCLNHETSMWPKMYGPKYVDKYVHKTEGEGPCATSCFIVG